MTESMRGMRLGSQSMERETGVELAERQSFDYLCPNQHAFSLVFALGAEPPVEWECKKCQSVAHLVGSEKQLLVEAGEVQKPRTHYDMVLERRTKAELEELLKEVLADMRKRRAEGRLTA
ncbi:MAG: hypothetical protein RL224_301 [Actinomycetota bacterium]